MQNEKNKLFVNNFSYDLDDEGLESIFAEINGVKVVEAKVIIDKYNEGRSKGFGFVTLETEDMAQACISEINGKEIGGRKIFVNVARPQEKRDNAHGGFSGNRRFGR